MMKNDPKHLDWPLFLTDKRVNCLSGLGLLTVDEYLEIVEAVYKNDGGIEGQRAPLKTKTGITIRKRMVEDLRHGAVLPPLVLGAVLTKQQIAAAQSISDNSKFCDFLKNIPPNQISIIDGMQRTTALQEARRNGLIGTSPVRVELWLSEAISSLIYRMLVLNTGQVPWDIKRQLETIYKQIVQTIKNEVKEVDVIEFNDTSRRSEAGTYRSTRIIELFLAFTSRTPHIELKEKVAADFARMDATEVTSHSESINLFTRAIKILADLDRALSSFSMNKDEVDERTRFKDGKDIFTSAPSSIGLVSAVAQNVLGKPGYEIDFHGAESRMALVEKSISELIRKSKCYEGDFADLLTLNEKVSRRSGRIGEFERDFFFKAFEHLISNASELTNLTPCWHAYQ